MENSVFQGVGGHMLSLKILTAKKAILSMFSHFYAILLCID